MDITETEAAVLVGVILKKLDEMKARDVVDGINESQRLGVEEAVGRMYPPNTSIHMSEIKTLGTVRRRPPTNIELLQLAFQRIHQRVNVLPAIAEELEKMLGTCEIVWRVDESFIGSDRAQQLEAVVTELRPDGISSVVSAYKKLRTLIPELVPDSEVMGTNG